MLLSSFLPSETWNHRAAAEARLHAAGQHAAGTVPWVRANNHEVRATCSCSKTSNQVAQISSQEQMTHGMPGKKTNDGDILIHPALVLCNLEACDTANAKFGAARNRQKTEGMYHIRSVKHSFEENISEVPALATVVVAVHVNITLWVAVRPRRCIADELLSKMDVVRAMHKRVQLCQDPRTAFAFIREGLGVSRINHTFRVHGHTILTEEAAAKNFQ